MAEIIVDVPAGYTGRVHIALHSGDTASTATEVTGEPEDFAVMVKRFADFESDPHQEVANQMQALG